jgi:kinesin family protein 18/19
MKLGSNNILVAVRVRPMLQRELSVLEMETVKILDGKMVVLLDPENEWSKDVK